PFPCARMENGAIDASSAEIRRLIRLGGSWRFLVPGGARAVIEKKGLYGCAAFAGRDEAPERDPLRDHGSRECMALAREVEGAAREILSFERFLHSRGVALMAWDLCARFGVDPARGYLAGIGHDLAKRMSDADQISHAKRYGGEILEVQREKPSLLHGRAAAAILRDRFGVRDEGVLEAVALHTFGGPGMGDLAKAVYVADKMETSREKIDPDLRRAVLAAGNLDDIFVAALERNVAALSARKLRLSEETLSLLEKARSRDRRR
ncbi:MAG: bis(5'-nucleosyl)-tetraphosphatase (symmetrical) YqeK, partial [Treponema sp.]|nr:bis(5'-nucleosyl)-tetraphosphatase (symmetrical) YqeK [Treponema sp.]